MRIPGKLPVLVAVALTLTATGLAAGPAGASQRPGGPTLATSPAAGTTGALTTRVRASTAVANSRISEVLATRTTNPVLGSDFTMTVWDTAEGRYVYTKADAAILRGASTTKLLSGVAVLQAWGAEHRMPTQVMTGRAGEIVLRAGGDPLLTSIDLRNLARSTATALKSGALGQPAPTEPSPSQSPTSTTTPAASPSAAGASAQAIRAAGSVVVRADDSRFPGSGQARGWPNSYLPWQVRPVNAFARDNNRSSDSAADAGRYFARALAGFGIAATYGGEATTPAGARTIATFAGHTVGQSLARELLVSDNDIAEMLFRQVAVAAGRTADWDGARSATRAVLADLGIPLAGVEIVDGSGLSLDARLTAGALTAVLAKVLQHQRLAALRGWLPLAGRTGTLRSADGRYNTAPSRCAAGLIRAKTGTLADAIALAGYATGSDGNTKIFVAIVNHRPTGYSRLSTRRAVDRVASSVTGCW
jgi:D-alanyl-D-alanine carboxypeptidase/D-alanyl-D-alanine-endopeptidase (penicillin-binding protein 4)